MRSFSLLDDVNVAASHYFARVLSRMPFDAPTQNFGRHYDFGRVHRSVCLGRKGLEQDRKRHGVRRLFSSLKSLSRSRIVHRAADFCTILAAKRARI